MKALISIKNNVRLWFLKRAHRKVKRKKKFFSYNRATSFGIIYDASNEDSYRDLTYLVRDLQQDQKKVKTLGFVAQKKMPEYCFPKLTFEFCKASDFSWTQQPTAQNVREFIYQGYDVLIDLTPSSFYQCKYLCAISPSRMITGRYAERYVDVYDLMLQVDDTMSVKETGGQVIHYLKMFNNEQSND